MARLAYLASLFFLAIGGAGALGQEGRLQHVRDQVRAPDESSEGVSSSSDDDDEGPLSWLFTNFIEGLFTAGEGSDGDANLAPVHRFFLKYPYEGDYPGFMIPRAADLPEPAKTWAEQHPPKAWHLRLSLEDGNDFDGLNRVGGQLFLEGSSRLGLLTNWNYYHERLSCGCTDDLVIGDANLTYRVLGHLGTSWRLGLGVRTLLDHAEPEFGFNFHTGLDLAVVKPLVFSLAMDLGTLGSASVFHWRATVGVTRHGWEAFTGYDQLYIGDANLHGPMLGVRLWF